MSATHHSKTVHSYSHSLMRHSHSNEAPILSEVWGRGIRPLSYTQSDSPCTLWLNMAERWLRRLDLLDNVARNNRDRRRPYIFYYGKYDEEQFRCRYRVTKDGFWELLDIIRPEISAHNDRGKPMHTDRYTTFVDVKVLRYTGYISASMLRFAWNFAAISKWNYKASIRGNRTLKAKLHNVSWR